MITYNNVLFLALKDGRKTHNCNLVVDCKNKKCDVRKNKMLPNFFTTFDLIDENGEFTSCNLYKAKLEREYVSVADKFFRENWKWFCENLNGNIFVITKELFEDITESAEYIKDTCAMQKKSPFSKLPKEFCAIWLQGYEARVGEKIDKSIKNRIAIDLIAVKDNEVHHMSLEPVMPCLTFSETISRNTDHSLPLVYDIYKDSKAKLFLDGVDNQHFGGAEIDVCKTIALCRKLSFDKDNAAVWKNGEGQRWMDDTYPTVNKTGFDIYILQ